MDRKVYAFDYFEFWPKSLFNNNLNKYAVSS